MQHEPLAAPQRVGAVEAVGAALLRVLSGDARLHWNGQGIYQGTQPIALLAPHQVVLTGSWQEQRALLDGAALRLRCSDAALHAVHAPTEPVERMVYEWLEQLRSESLVPADWPGVRHNLALHFQRWCQHFVDSGLTESSLGILLFTLAITIWSRLSGTEVPHSMADLAEATRANMSSTVGHCWAALRQHRHCQSAFIP
ncbi:MAG: cobalt chelatase, partial [Rhodoferax sp.]|nr:cobalt chelatase [Rhodoferax sp.]